MPDMHCREIAARTTDYLEGALPQNLRREWQSHIEACCYCARYVAQIRATVRLLAQLDPPLLAGSRR